MAYVKNVFDRDSITGSFLNSDDTGLTTNVFLTEPRLYGLRVTKNWSGGVWWAGANPNHTGPYPLTVELGGALQRVDAPYDPVVSAGGFSGGADPALAQNRDLDRGEHGEARLTWRPDGGVWHVSGAVQFGKAKSVDKVDGLEAVTACYLISGKYDCSQPPLLFTAYNWAKGTVTNHEEHLLADFSVGRDFGLGSAFTSTISAGIQYADLQSRTRLDIRGIPDWNIPAEGAFLLPATRHYYDTDLSAEREFKGVGPKLSLDAAKRLFGSDEAGHLDLDVSLNGGVLFGKQKNSAFGQETARYYNNKYSLQEPDPQVGPTVVTTGPAPRSRSVTVSMAGASLGLSYEIQRVKIGAGYRWERYFDALDVGYDEPKDADRTLDGPYFRIAVGFGG